MPSSAIVELCTVLQGEWICIALWEYKEDC